eukprot:31248-Pelagococcus_subviridis.AAC.6
MQQVRDHDVQAKVELDDAARVLRVLPSLRLPLRLRELLVIDQLLPHAREVGVRDDDVRVDRLPVLEPHADDASRRLAPRHLACARRRVQRLGEDRGDARVDSRLRALLVRELLQTPSHLVEAPGRVPHPVRELGRGEQREHPGGVVRAQADVQLLVREQRTEALVFEIFRHLRVIVHTSERRGGVERRQKRS